MSDEEKRREHLLSCVLEIVATTPTDGVILGKHADVLVEELRRLRASLTAVDKELPGCKEASVLLRRLVSGDVEWTATQFREFMNSARDLCNATDALVRIREAP